MCILKTLRLSVLSFSRLPSPGEDPQYPDKDIVRVLLRCKEARYGALVEGRAGQKRVCQQGTAQPD